MKYYKFTIVILLSLLISACSKSVKSENTTHLRASWVATVEQLDWPKSVPVFTADRIATQKKRIDCDIGRISQYGYECHNIPSQT
ncbi:hypothetical protein Rin_00011480 [Candidatus Regiella insecticola 5.15]|uniref:Uncharacterized protein n=1 Tax=Candidatus Regiella insecticola 5.15 TaxID=1005043 RepID=G2GZD3_9ENTR|nr:hypothetical protein Rin_00011480 [Candidatus Regiella insecticola 5.15]